MKFVPENIIEQQISIFEKEDVFIEHITIMFSEQPTLYNYLQDDNLSLLTKNESDLLTYLLCIIYFSARKVNGTFSPVKAKILEQNEESNWEILNGKANQNFSRKLDQFFINYPQEDLLALVEDSVTPDEDSEISAVGAEIIFISCKSWIDCLDESVHNN